MSGGKNTSEKLFQGEGASHSPRYDPFASRPPSRTASRQSSHSQQPGDNDTAARVATPVSLWTYDKLNKELFNTLTYVQIKEISKHGAAALWEALQVNDMSDDWTRMNDICARAFPSYNSMSEKDAHDAAEAATIQHLRGLQTTPPPADLPDPKTPKAVRTVPPGPDTEMEDADEVSRMEIAAQTDAKAAELL